MDVHCEGTLLVPPDRGTIIGRAVWKPRFVVLGRQTRAEHPPPRSASSSKSSTGRKSVKPPLSKQSKDSLDQSARDGLWLSIYKQNDEGELISQYPASSIASCAIKDVQYRKPGPTLPTLVITFGADPATEKARKRRSSRSGLPSANSQPNSLLFRTAPDERYSICDWQATIQLQIKPKQIVFDAPPLSPDSPAFTTFVTPFSPRSPTLARSPVSPKLEPQRVSPGNIHAFTQHASTRDRGQTSTLISPSPSLRSKSSNISSQASSFGRQHGYQNMLPIQQLPSDLPSPASTNGFDDQSILGWTSAQGRSSTLSSHTRGSNSISVAGTPPAPRETILDRAFMMKYIPGSDRLPEAEDDGGKLSSIARFEALMREAEERRAQAGSSKTIGKKLNGNGWNLEEDEQESEESDVEGEATRPGTSDYAGRFGMEDGDVDPIADRIREMPTPAQRALEYISGHSTPREYSERRPLPPEVPIPPMSPPRSKTTPPRVRRKERPKSLYVHSSTKPPPEKVDHDPHASSTITATALKRRSSTSTKRRSLTDFAKRLSGTSSLLIVQTNASSSASVGAVSSRNSRQSSVASFAEPDEVMLHRGLSQSRLSGMSGISGARGGGQLSEMDAKRCGWRGSGLGVFGEGGFL